MLQTDAFYAKNGLYNKFNSLINHMRSRDISKNIKAVKEEVAGL